MDNNQFQIDRYLQNEMSAAEKQEFEAKLATDKMLQKELEVQQQLIQAVQHAGIKNEFGKAIRQKVVAKQLLRWGIVLTVVAVIAVIAISNDWFKKKHSGSQPVSLTIPEKFEINTAADTIIETRDGVVFAIPANAFNNQSGQVQVEIKTALDANAIMQNGLSTVSNTDMLQTAGMFYINASENGQPVVLEKEIAVSVPAKNGVNPAMKLFDGVADSSGNINWINPRPVEKKLRTVDITRLNFYPPDYLPTLKALSKDYKNKRYTDSLYYSFAGYLDGPEINPVVGAESEVYESDPAPDTAKKKVKDTIGIVEQLGSDNIEKAADTSNYFHYEVDPARIRTIWNKKFNNTILATKEFEERLKYIHSLCDKMYLDAYLQGLNKPLHEIDQLLADASYGEIKKKFQEFANRKDGKVIIAEGMQQKLNVYFEQKFKAYQEAAIKTRSKYEAELLRLDEIADAKQRQQAIDDFLREKNNFREELCVNLTEAYKQIGVKRSCNDTINPPDRPSYNITISTTGWKNLDVYVFESTRDRQTVSYTDSVTGQTAKLVYNEMSIQVENEKDFDKVLVYLVPDSLSSFQRVNKGGNLYKEKLNSLFRYDAIVLAYKGTETYYYQQRSVQPTNYTFSLSKVSQEDLRKILNTYTGSRKASMQKEVEYQLFDQQEMMRQVQVQKDREFREQVLRAIFKCFDALPSTPSTVPAVK